DLIDAEIVVARALQLLAAQAGIAPLHFAQKAFFGSEQSALPVHVNRSAFKHHVLRIVLVLDEWFPLSTAEQFLHAAGQLVVEMPVVVLGPRIETPVSESDLPLGVAHKNGAGVARPSAIRGPAMKTHSIEVHAGTAEHALYAPLHRRVFHDQVHALARGEKAYDLRIKPRDRRKFARPILGIVRPRQPRGL